MSDEVRIVPAREEHIDAACDIAIAAWTPIREVFRRDLGDEIYESQFTGWQQSKRDAVSAGLRGGRGYVALVGDTVAGFIHYRINEATKTGEICGNAVNPEIRGKGIGPKMYEFVLNKMREEGMLFATVHTGLDDGHAPARRAYEKAGFHANLPSINYYQKL